MSELLEHSEESIRRRRLLRPGQAVVVAVSGGLDSMVLLEVLGALAKRHGWRLTVAHFNHQLRGRSSLADERLVRQTAGRHGLRVVVERGEVRQFASDQKLSIEMAARKSRHEFLARAAKQAGAKTLALAHHANDQIELFLLRLLRGSGSLGLAGMRWRGPSPADRRVEVVRPLLDQPKEALKNFAAAHHLRFREDASNACLDYDRNRLRHELVPLLERQYQPALRKVLLRVMELVGAEAEFALKTAEVWLEEQLASGRAVNAKRGLPHPVAFDDLAVAVQRRALQLQLLGFGIVPEFELIEALRREPGRAVNFRRGMADKRQEDQAKGQCQALRDANGLIRLKSVPEGEFCSESAEVSLKGTKGGVDFEGVALRWRLERQKGAKRPPRQSGRECFDAQRVGTAIILRHWRPGDRFRPIGLNQEVKLQDLFTNLRIPRGRRHELIVATTAQDEVFWVEGMRISERFKLSSATIHRLHWAWRRLK